MGEFSLARGFRALTAGAAMLLVGGCTDQVSVVADSPSPASSSATTVATSSPTRSPAGDSPPASDSPVGSSSASVATRPAASQPVVKAPEGAPWQVEGEAGLSVVVAAPDAFSPAAEFDVPAKQVAVTIAFELENEGESPYSSDGFTARLVSSEECEGFAFLSEGVSGVPEVVDAGKAAKFKYGYFCKGKSGDKLTLEVGLDPNGAITKIKTEIP